MQTRGGCLRANTRLVVYPNPKCSSLAASLIVSRWTGVPTTVPTTVPGVLRLHRIASAVERGPVSNAKASPPGTDAALTMSPEGLQQRLLGVDYGTSTTGLALGRGGVSSALKAIPSVRTGKLSDTARQVLEVALQHGVEAMVVGIPVVESGSIVKPHTDSAMGHKCRNLAHTLALMAKEHGLSVYLYNERGTTRAALKGMGYNWQDRLSTQEKKATMVDAESAAMLLRLYYGDPRLAVRVNPRVVIKRGTENKSTD